MLRPVFLFVTVALLNAVSTAMMAADKADASQPSASQPAASCNSVEGCKGARPGFEWLCDGDEVRDVLNEHRTAVCSADVNAAVCSAATIATHNGNLEQKLDAIAASVGGGAAATGGDLASAILANKGLIEGATAAANGAKEQASIAPRGGATFAGIYKLAEDPATINLVTNMEAFTIIVPADWECQTQARTGQFSCPEGEPSSCRYYHNANMEKDGKCVYYYCAKIYPDDSCCRYFTGALPGSESIGDTVISWTDGTNETYAQFAESSHAGPTCGGTVNALNGKADGMWWKNWWEDDAMDAYDNTFTNSMINFKIMRSEFSTMYGLFLYSMNGDVVIINKNAAGNYTAQFQPIQSTTQLTLTPDAQFVLPEKVEAAATSAPAAGGTRRRLSTGNKALTTVDEMIKEHRAMRFMGSCDP